MFLMTYYSILLLAPRAGLAYLLPSHQKCVLFIITNTSKTSGLSSSTAQYYPFIHYLNTMEGSTIIGIVASIMGVAILAGARACLWRSRREARKTQEQLEMWTELQRLE